MEIQALDRDSYVDYNRHMKTILRTDEFIKWVKELRDSRAKAAIAARIDRMSTGNLGDIAPVGDGVSEARIHYGPATVFILLNKKEQF